MKLLKRILWVVAILGGAAIIATLALRYGQYVGGMH